MKTNQENHPEADEIAISWGVEDVLEVRPALTQKQARQVLAEVKRRHDANIGINWDVLEATADSMFSP